MKTILKFSVCFILVFLGKNSFAQNNKLPVGTWVYSGANPIQKNYTEEYDSNFTDTIIFSEDYKYSNNKSRPDDVLTWDYDTTEKTLLIMDMMKMEGKDYLIKILNEKELVFNNGFRYTRIK